VFSPTIGRQLLELGLIDEIDLHIAPVLLGEGIRLYDNPGSEPIRLHRVGECDPTSTATYGIDPPQRRSSRPRQCRVSER
jgi:riboflavin biosynthesis pyrimidine reductase